MRRPTTYTIARAHGHTPTALLSLTARKPPAPPAPTTTPAAPQGARPGPATRSPAAYPRPAATPPVGPHNAAREAPAAPVTWWTGSDARSAIAEPPHPRLWEWWCEVLRTHGYTSATVRHLRGGPPPEVVADAPPECMTPQPGQVRLHRAWAGGWPDVYPPIAEVLHAERAAAHASEMAEARERQDRAIAEAQEAELARQIQARKAAADAAAREAQLLSVSRSAAILAGASVAKTADALRVLIERSLPAWTAEGQEVSLADATKYLQNLAAAGSRLASLGEALARTERMPSGDPGALIGGTPAASPRSREEAEDTLRMVSAILGGRNDTGPAPLPHTLPMLPEGAEGLDVGAEAPEGMGAAPYGYDPGETPVPHDAPDAYALAVEAEAARTLGAAQAPPLTREGPPDAGALPAVLDAPTAPAPPVPQPPRGGGAPAVGPRRPPWAGGGTGGGSYG